MTDPQPIALRVVISGHVQGVSYRWHTVQQARALGLAGTVRNEHDGTVHAHVQGAGEAVERLIGWMRRGPSAARVTAVVTDPAEPLPGLTDFRQSD